MDFKIKFHYTRYFVLVLFIIFLLNGITENILIKRKINKFKSSTTLVLNDVENGLKVFSVSRETTNSSLNYIDNLYYIGSNGDILLSKKANYVNIPIVKEVFSFFFGGHAAIVDNDIKKTIEVVGNTSNNKVSIYDNDWYNLGECIGVRLINNDIKDSVIDSAYSKIGKNYNYSFIFNNGYYCTDLISKSVSDVSNINLNDFGITTVNDIILSKNVEICYYQYTDNNGIKYIYYID